MNPFLDLSLSHAHTEVIMMVIHTTLVPRRSNQLAQKLAAPVNT